MTTLRKIECVTPVETVVLTRTRDRAYQTYDEGQKPYDDDESLSQKLWSVVYAELGPNAADVLVKKLHGAVIDHVTKGGVK